MTLTLVSFALFLAFFCCGCWNPKEKPLEKAERLLLKGDAASLREAIVALREALQADPQAVRVHALLGTAYAKEARNTQSRDQSEERYSLAIAQLEKAVVLYGQAGAPTEVYQQLSGVCQERALLPRRFNVERDLKMGVGPWEVKAMEKAVKALEEGRAHFPENPAFSVEKVKALRKELMALQALYIENVHRTWLSRPSGFVPPEQYKKTH